MTDIPMLEWPDKVLVYVSPSEADIQAKKSSGSYFFSAKKVFFKVNSCSIVTPRDHILYGPGL